MDTAGAEPTPRDLLSVGPTGYVARRDELVRIARAAGAKETARRLKALPRPGIGLWAALVAAVDEDAVRAAIDATAQLAATQAAGGAPAEVGAAAAERRRRIDALVAAGMARLAEHGSGGATRRAEVAGIVDQLTRHAELVDTWLDGSLRDLPDAETGFDAFAGLTVEAPVRERGPLTPVPTPTARPVRPARPAPQIDERAAARTAATAALARAVGAEERAEAASAAASRTVDRLETELAEARAALARAEELAASARDAVVRARRERAALDDP